MICKHHFIKLSEISKPRPGTTGMHIGVVGAEVACVHCGQIRKVWSDGTIEIVIEAGTPIKEDQ